MDAIPEGGPERRARLTQEIAQRTGIDNAMIERLVRRFYDRARRDPLLGPVFDSRISDWEPHIARIAAFWSSVTLMTGVYHGQPTRLHLGLPIEARHFDRWLELFEATARDECPPVAALYFIERAYRIADSMELAVNAQHGILPTAARRRIPPSV